MKTKTIPMLISTVFAATLLATAAHAADVRVTVEGVASAEGKVMLALFDKAADFPRGKMSLGNMAPAAAGAVKVVFADVAPGRYAISAFHDVNGNQRLDANMVGIPSEPYGFSKDARGKMGPPSFDEAAFEVGKDTVNLTIRVK